MGTKSWTADYQGHRITVRNHFQWLPMKTWESLEISGRPEIRQAGGLFRGAAIMFAPLDTDAGAVRLEVRLAQVVGGVRTGCHILVDGKLIGGDTDKELNYPDPRTWEAVRARGLLRFLAIRGVARMGVPFALVMMLTNRNATISVRLVVFVLQALFFGTVMGYLFWRSGVARYESYRKAVKAVRDDGSRAA